MLPEECDPNGGPCTQRPPAPPLDIPGLEDVQKVRVGDAHSCALTSAGGLHGWGRNPHRSASKAISSYQSRSSPTWSTSPWPSRPPAPCSPTEPPAAGG